jgi:Asp-tRNA(Asn)/Glu-tRNA(Gln) amidotransferase A subunit family amidase
LAPSLDTVGVLARRAADCAVVTTILGEVPEGPGIALSVGMGGFGSGPPERSLPDRLRALGMSVATEEFEPDTFARLMRPALFVAEAEGAVIHAALLEDAAAEMSPELRRMFGWARAQPLDALVRARAELAEAVPQLVRKIREFGCVITPTTPTVADRFGESGAGDAARFTLAASLCGLPAVAVPLGVDADGLPRSIQIVAEDAGLALGLADLLAETPPAPALL